MCYLVTALPPSATTGIRTHYQAIFTDLPDSSETLTPLERAQIEAERLLRSDHTDVQVWKLHASPKVVKTIDWSSESG